MIGMMIYEMFAGHVAYVELSVDDAIRKITSGEPPKQLLAWRCPEQMWELFEECTKPDPAERPDLPKLIKKLESRRKPHMITAMAAGMEAAYEEAKEEVDRELAAEAAAEAARLAAAKASQTLPNGQQRNDATAYLLQQVPMAEQR
jgi:hypothetical protein